MKIIWLFFFRLIRARPMLFLERPEIKRKTDSITKLKHNLCAIIILDILGKFKLERSAKNWMKEQYKEDKSVQQTPQKVQALSMLVT